MDPQAEDLNPACKCKKEGILSPFRRREADWNSEGGELYQESAEQEWE